MFERLTMEARTVVVRAQEEARLAGHGEIGTEHLLLGIITGGGDDPVVEMLRDAGVTVDAARAAVRQLRPEASGTPGFVPYTARGRAAFEHARAAADAQPSPYLHPGHLFLGATAEEQAGAVRVLRSLEADVEALRRAAAEGPSPQ